ncbi:MAG: hypothetical protein KDC34_17695 [Saprospiraceae bacterium]|nr:hypothetical protein [Saprospiraceae bacterium]
MRLQAGDSNPVYWQLFEAVAGSAENNESSFQEHFPDAPFLKNLPVTKRYLEHWILNQLDRYRKKNIEESCLDELNRVRVWIDRRFWKKAGKELKKVYQRAIDYELFDIQLHCCRLEKQLMGQGSSPEVIEALFQREQRCLNNLTNLNQYWLVQNRLYEIQRRQDRTDTELARWGEHALLKNISAASNLQSRIFFHQAKAIYAFTKGDGIQAMQSNQATLQLLDENPKLIRLYPERYLSTLNNFLVDCLEAGKPELLEKGLLQLRELPARKEFNDVSDLDARVFRQSYLLDINRVLRDKKYEAGLGFLPELEAGLSRYGDRIARHHRLTLSYLAGYIYFLNREWVSALRLLQPLARDEKEDVVLEILRYGRLLFLLVHFELKHEELVESLLASFRRTGKKAHKRMEVENWVLRYVRKSITHGREPLSVAEKEDLLKWKVHPEENRFFQYIDLEHWLKI